MSSRSATWRIISVIGLTFAVFYFGWPGAAQADDDEPLIVHEWGTFTALQDEHGNALPGINIDDEPLPAFCHNLSPWAIERPHGMPRVMMKGVPERHPYVTLRLETPVLYFHPPKSEKLPFSVDVDVKFHGGWLTEFYPQAEPQAPGLKDNEFKFGPITPDTLGGLTWHSVQVGGGGRIPETDRHIWLPPREVNAALVSVGPQTSRDSEAESEKFLFYRGVANRPVPLRVTRDEPNHWFEIHGQCADVLSAGQSAKIEKLWMVHIRKDGAVAWRAIDPITVSHDTAATLATVSEKFPDSGYSPAHLDSLRDDMHKALTAAGLYDDEATAMLETWKHAYFQSPGLRLFYLVPRVWTDAVLPLKLSRPAQITRVMMGRLELISPEQRALLKKLSTIALSDPKWMFTIPQSASSQKFFEGRSDFGDLGVAIPADYQTYLDLGRFRNALIVAEQKARPTQELQSFINVYGLGPYELE
ncbi:MAG TPA: hypothetical protein VFE47_19995 [Tepidisphaeraceae bacterium]|jgi:hypothetical protein|nr:hypothetical protein [Tepidisphaeraceae bacterium]